MKQKKVGIMPNFHVFLAAFKVVAMSIFSEMRKREYMVPTEAPMNKNSACFGGYIRFLNEVTRPRKEGPKIMPACDL